MVARHVLQCTFYPHVLSRMASYDLAMDICWAHVDDTVNPRFLSRMASYDIASAISSRPRPVTSTRPSDDSASALTVP